MPDLKLSYNKDTYTASYIEYGEGDKVLVVYHGFGQKKEDYLPLIKLFPDYKIIVFDLFDHGDSSSIPNWEDLVDVFLLAFDELLDLKKLNQVEVLGFSIGCRVAAIIASKRHPGPRPCPLEILPATWPEPLNLLPFPSFLTLDDKAAWHIQCPSSLWPPPQPGSSNPDRFRGQLPLC